MPFKAYKDGKEINSLDYRKEEMHSAWTDLGESNIYSGYTELSFKCCNARVFCKKLPVKDKLGNTKYYTPLFAHDHLPERCLSNHPDYREANNPIHIVNQMNMLEACMQLSDVQEADLEHYGKTEDGEVYRIDLYLKRWNIDFAIELQITKQSAEKYLHRSNNYIKDGYTPIWFYKYSNHKSLKSFTNESIFLVEMLDFSEEVPYSVEEWKKQINKITYKIYEAKFLTESILTTIKELAINDKNFEEQCFEESMKNMKNFELFNEINYIKKNTKSKKDFPVDFKIFPIRAGSNNMIIALEIQFINYGVIKSLFLRRDNNSVYAEMRYIDGIKKDIALADVNNFLNAHKSDSLPVKVALRTINEWISSCNINPYV